MLKLLAILCLLSTPVLAAPHLTFEENFTNFVNSPDGSQGWMTTFPYGPPNSPQARTLASNNEAECYSDSSVGVNPFIAMPHKLTINANPSSGNICNLPYTSGLITTYSLFAQTYGTYEITAKLPKGQGLWPAFWFLPSSNLYTAELDAFEVLGNDPTTLYFTTHGSDINGNWSTNFQTLHVMDLSAAFHVYTLHWGPKNITLSIDHTVVGQAPTPYSMNQPMYMLLNLAVGGVGSWPGPPNVDTLFPAQYIIKNVRVWSNE